MTKFMVMEMDWLAELSKIPLSSDTHSIVYIDPYELEEQTRAAFFDRIWFGVTGKGSKNKVQVSDLYDKVLQFALKRHLVLVIRGANYLPFSDKSFWGNVRSLLAYPEHVHVLFVTYDGGNVSIDEEQFDPVRPLLNQNVIRLNELSKEDIEYSIDRWGYTLEYSYSLQEKNEIRRISGGKPALIKACCFAAAERSPIPMENHPLVADVLEKRISTWIYPRSLSRLFTARERELYKLFTGRVGLVVTKDEIASVLWGSEVKDRYSDAAIAQAVSRIRSKMKQIPEVTGVIETMYGQGYAYADVTGSE